MISKISLLVIIFSIALIACEKDKEQTPEGAADLIGSWINPQYTDNVVVYDKSNSLKDSNYGFSFSSANLFIERKNSGFCGTPPIYYADFEGTWTQKDSILNISVDFWGGIVDYKWKIISINKDQLTLVELENVYHGLNKGAVKNFD